MAGVVSLIPDQVLSEPALPDAVFVACHPNGGEPFLLWKRSRKMALDQPPTGREISIALRQSPDRVQMVRQHDESVDRERQLSPRGCDRTPQKRDVFDQQACPPFQQIDGEEPAAAMDERATIIGHGRQLTGATSGRNGGLRYR